MDRIEGFAVARIEMGKDGHEPSGGDVLPHGESRVAGEADAGERQVAKPSRK